MLAEFVALLLSVLIIASTSIGIQCIGSDTSKKSNKGFLIFMLVVAILSTLGSLYFLFKPLMGLSAPVVPLEANGPI